MLGEHEVSGAGVVRLDEFPLHHRQSFEKGAHVRRPARRAQPRMDFAPVGQQAHAVARMERDVSKAQGRRHRVVQFRQPNLGFWILDRVDFGFTIGAHSGFSGCTGVRSSRRERSRSF